MREKKMFKAMKVKLSRFQEEERSAVSRALADGKCYPEKQLELMKLVQEGGLCRHYGLLALLYNCYCDLAGGFDVEERQSERFFNIRWASYTKAYKHWNPPEKPGMGMEMHLDREAIRVLITNKLEGWLRYSDFSNADMMIEDWGDRIRYCHIWKAWLIWNDRFWRKDEEEEIYEMGRKTIEDLPKRMPQFSTMEESETLLSHTGRSRSIRKVEAMITLVKSASRIRTLPEDFDRDDFLFNCSNGILDLHSGRLLPHDRNKLMTRISPVAYNEEADCPRWKQFLKDVFDGNRDLIRFVRKFLGCCMTGDTSCQCMFILYGSGANGKSTFINLVSSILGDYAMTTATDTFMQKRGNQSSNDIARLRGSRMVSATETDERGNLAEATIKSITGNDEITARFLYGEYFSFRPSFKIVMATNHKPRIKGSDYAIWRRLRLIPFNVSFPEEKQDKKLYEKLEAEREGILRWMVEGCLLWQKEGLGQVAAIAEATEEYKKEMSEIQSFISECCVRDEEAMIMSSKLHKHYARWCEDNGEKAKSVRSFSIKLAESGIDKTKHSEGMFWHGLRMKEGIAAPSPSEASPY